MDNYKIIEKGDIKRGYLQYGERQIAITDHKLGDTIRLPHSLSPGQVILCDNPKSIISKEADPDGLKQNEVGAKLDAGKPDASLLLMFGKALREVAQVGTFGATKYTRGGWQSVSGGIERYTAALLRHLLQEHYEELDTDSNLLHSAQVAWNALARLELILRERDSA